MYTRSRPAEDQTAAARALSMHSGQAPCDLPFVRTQHPRVCTTGSAAGQVPYGHCNKLQWHGDATMPPPPFRQNATATAAAAPHATCGASAGCRTAVLPRGAPEQCQLVAGPASLLRSLLPTNTANVTTAPVGATLLHGRTASETAGPHACIAPCCDTGGTVYGCCAAAAAVKPPCRPGRMPTPSSVVCTALVMVGRAVCPLGRWA